MQIKFPTRIYERGTFKKARTPSKKRKYPNVIFKSQNSTSALLLLDYIYSSEFESAKIIEKSYRGVGGKTVPRECHESPDQPRTVLRTRTVKLDE